MHVVRIFFISVLLFGSVAVTAQNVGINKTNPQQSLDVNGNVNIDGKIYMNGVSGTTGQVLQTTSSGSTAWANLKNYTYVATYTNNGNFIVPAGVTRILIEAWGAGGGGSSGGGGAAGNYIFSVQDVTPSTSLTITIGTGGLNATTNPGAATDGGETKIEGLMSPLTALGGGGSGSNSPGSSNRYALSGAKFIQVLGQNGETNTTSYTQKNATTFVTIQKYGDGGASGPNYNVKCQGQTIIVNESTGILISNNLPTAAPYPGGGGSGGSLGKDGANGMVLIWY